MPEDKRIDRREAIKSVAVGVGVVSSLPILNNGASAQVHQHHVAAPLVADTVSKAPAFFNKHQFATITELASLIIPTDETPGAREAKVNEYIDLIVGESAFDVQKDISGWFGLAGQGKQGSPQEKLRRSLERTTGWPSDRNQQDQEPCSA